MICPQCGYDMGTKHTCIKCGYEVKNLVVMDEETRKKREEAETKVIDPDSTILTDEYGYPVDEEEAYYADPLSAIFGDFFGDPFADLLGGLFGFSTQPPPRRAAPAKKEKRDDNVVEVKKVEIYDEDGNPVKQESKFKQTMNKAGKKIKTAAKNVKDKFKKDEGKN